MAILINKSVGDYFEEQPEYFNSDESKITLKDICITPTENNQTDLNKDLNELNTSDVIKQDEE